MHIVVMGCGRVGSSLALQLVAPRAQRRGHRPGPAGVPPARRRLRRPAGHRRRLRPRDPDRGRHRAGRRVRRGQQRRQLQHHRRPRRPRDLRRRSTSSPASTTRSAPRSTSGWASPPSPPCPWTASRLLKSVLGEATAEVWRDPSGAVAHAARRRRTRAGSGARSPSSRRPPAPGSAWSPASASAQLPEPRHGDPVRRRLHVLATDDARRAAARRRRRAHRREVTDEGRHRRRRRGRPLDRPRAASATATRCC